MEDFPGKSFCGDLSIYFKLSCKSLFLLLSYSMSNPSPNTIVSIFKTDLKFGRVSLSSKLSHLSSCNSFLRCLYFHSWPTTSLFHMTASPELKIRLYQCLDQSSPMPPVLPNIKFQLLTLVHKTCVGQTSKMYFDDALLLLFTLLCNFLPSCVG